MLEAQNYVGLYGAVLSTILALIVIISKMRESRPFRIRKYSDLALPSQRIEAHLTNMSPFTVATDGVWLGYSFRRWYWPFRRDFDEGYGMGGYNIETDQKVHLETKLFGPGSHLILEYNSERQYQSRQKWLDWKGFDYRLSIMIDHSLSKTAQILVFS